VPHHSIESSGSGSPGGKTGRGTPAAAAGDLDLLQGLATMFTAQRRAAIFGTLVPPDVVIHKSDLDTLIARLDRPPERHERAPARNARQQAQSGRDQESAAAGDNSM
jgi:hypothetical protein